MMIPVLPCTSLPETLHFYRSLGFEITHEQSRPNPYGATRRGPVHLHFTSYSGFDAASSTTTSLAIVPEVEALHQAFAEALRRTRGKVPLTGRPRLSRMRPGQSRFTLVDVDGNEVIFIRQGEGDPDGGEEGSRTRLGKALKAAARLRDFKNDDVAAARVLDAALARAEPASAVERVQALAARAEIALALGDSGRATELESELRALVLTEEERVRCWAELEALSRLAAPSVPR